MPLYRIERDTPGAAALTPDEVTANMTMPHVLTLLALILAVASCESATGPNVGITFEGVVYARLSPNPSNPTGPGVYTGLLSGAVVSTSLDSSTTKTDANGHFLLSTSKGPADRCTPYTVTVTAAGQPTYSLTGAWGVNPRNQTFSLTPPNPEKVGC